MRTILFALLCAAQVYAADRITGKPFATRSEVVAPHGMAATSQPLATQVALDILKQGGNAIDAAIAANAMQAVCKPTSCGIGGDLYAIVWDARTKKLYGLNASGRSPYRAPREFFAARKLRSIPSQWPLSLSVPGCVDGWDELRRKFGSRSFEQLLAPVIAYAEDGFPVTPVIAGHWK